MTSEHRDDESWARSTLRAAVADEHPSEDLADRARGAGVGSRRGAAPTWLLRAAVAALLVGAIVVIQLAKEPAQVGTSASSTTEAPTTTIGLPRGHTLELAGVSRLADGRVDATLRLTPTASGPYRVAAIYGSMQDPERSVEVAGQALDGEAGTTIELHLVFVEPPSLSVPPELGTTDRLAGYVTYSVSSAGSVLDLASGLLPDTTGLPVAEASRLLRLYSQSISTTAGTCEPGIVCGVTVISGSIPLFAAPDGQVSLIVGAPTSASP